MNVPKRMAVSPAPQTVSGLGGFFGQRFQASVDQRLKNHRFREEFIGLHERKDYSDWFWMGEQLGKWLEAAAYAALINDDQQLQDDVRGVLDRLEATQEADGYIGITNVVQRTPVRGMQLYEWYYVLHGLLKCHELLHSQKALGIAVRLGRFIVKTWGVHPHQFALKGPFPGNGHTGGEGTLILEPMALLGIAAAEKEFITWGQETLEHWDTWCDQYPMSTHTGSYKLMKAVAAGEADVHEIRRNIHAHTLHMTLLGVAAMYQATGKEQYRQTVLGCVDAIAERFVFLTGGMSAGERYVQYPYYHPNNEIEVCPQHTWILLLEHALQWTGKAKYAEEMERTMFNSLLAAQLADGSNWSYMTPMNGRAQEPSGPNCCNASGHRILARLPTTFYSEMDKGLMVNQWVPSVVNWTHRGSHIVLQQETEYPSEGSLHLTIQCDASVEFTLHLRIPSFARDVAVAVNGEVVTGAVAGEYLSMTRTWSSEDRIHVKTTLPLRVHHGDGEAALSKGPLVYCYFQKWQDNDGQFEWIQGAYPQDVQLKLGEDWEQALTWEAAPENALGPILRLPARRRAKAPMFANPEANTELPAAEDVEAVLLPFANQGLRRGHYAVFMPVVENHEPRKEVTSK